MKKVYSIALLGIIIGVFFSCKSSYTKEDKLILQHMYAEDQEIQRKMMNSIEDPLVLNTRRDSVFVVNYKFVKDLFQKKGIPTISRDGERTTFYFWLIVQHSDNDIDFQKNVLKDMGRAIKKGDINKRNYAYLYDRVAVNSGKKQKYGTQMVFDSIGVHSPAPIEDEKRVDERRISMGLDSLSTYLKTFN